MKTRNIGISELLQSGQLITLLTIAVGIGKIWAKIETKLDDHGKRITEIERVITSTPQTVVKDSVRKEPLKNLEQTQGFL